MAKNLKELPFFSGEKGYDTEEWIAKAKLALQLLSNDVGEPAQVIMLQLKLEKTAFLWAQNQVPDQEGTDRPVFSSVDNFFVRLRNRFITEGDVRRAKDEFYGAQQGRRTVLEFATDLQRKSMRVPEVTAAVALGIFERGVRPDIYTFMRLQTYNDFAGAL